jgi:hypothetical protein
MLKRLIMDKQTLLPWLPNSHKPYFTRKGKKVPFISGGKGGCFAAGTLISTPNGKVPIEEIRVGDEVLCFDEEQNTHVSRVTQTFIHENDTAHIVYGWNTELHVTPNHWFLTEANTFLPIESLEVDDALISEDMHIIPITYKSSTFPCTTYNFTVATFHTYFANGIRVHNKGGSKGGGATGGGSEAPNNLFSTDILFLTVALGEGPLYKINPNGLQDVEINESSIDDLLNLDGDGGENSEYFHVDTRTGTLSQTVMPIFGEEVVVPQSPSSAVVLKKGNIAGVPRAAVTLQNTSVNSWDSLRFMFNINALQQMDANGNVNGYSVSIKITVYDSTGSESITSAERTYNGKSNVPVRFLVELPIPEDKHSSNGYKFSIEKTSNDSDSSKIQDAIAFVSWQEVENDRFAYPRTALIGYAIKATGEHSGSVPTFTCMVKGLLCKVPSNYNQPILENGEIDWRQIETPSSGSYFYGNNGYRLQRSGSTVVTNTPKIYNGNWDGSFVYSWTQNAVWILYDILTNTTYGIGIPEENIDKWRFYKVARYCDAVDATTGEFIGVDGFADGTFRYKPKNFFTTIRETLVGIPSGTRVKERRFICDITIANQTQLMDLVTSIAGIFRGVLFYSGGKLSLNVDMPDELPAMMFNESNIEKGSIGLSGIKESEILTGVEVAYIEPNNHYRREVIRVDDSSALREQNQIENVAQIELTGCTRRGQAVRFAQYLLASSKYIRRKIQFTTTIEAIDLTIGSVIGVSQRLPGTSWGYGGRVASNSTVGTSNVVLEHYTSPAITSSVFSGNTLPLGLRVVNRRSDRVELYMISNTLYSSSSANTITGADLWEIRVIGKYIYNTRTFSTSNASIQFASNNVPVRGDLWSFGEINPSNFYDNQNDKLFKITGIDRDSQDFKIIIHANEYISNVYVDSDSLISYVPVRYKDTTSPLIAPPAPELELVNKTARSTDGSVRTDIEVYVSTDISGYPLELTTEIEYASPAYSLLIDDIIINSGARIEHPVNCELVLTGHAPTIAETRISVGQGNLVIDGKTPTVTENSGNRSFSPSQGNLIIDGKTPTVSVTGGEELNDQTYWFAGLPFGGLLDE